MFLIQFSFQHLYRLPKTQCQFLFFLALALKQKICNRKNTVRQIFLVEPCTVLQRYDFWEYTIMDDSQ